MSDKLVLSVRGSEPRVVIKSSVDLSELSQSEIEALKHFPVSRNIPLYLDYGQSYPFDTYSWTITGPSGYSQISPEKTSTSFIFKFKLVGKYIATITASYTDPQDPTNNWSEQETIRILVEEKVPYFDQLPNLDFIEEFLPSFYRLVDNLQFVKTIWSSAGSLLAQELLTAIEVDQSKSIETFPDVYQRKWVEYHPEIVPEEFEFKSFYLIKPIKDPSIVVSQESQVVYPSSWDLFSQITSKKTLQFSVKDYNSLNISKPSASISRRVFNISSGNATGFTFRVEQVSKDSVAIAPKLPSTLSKGDVFTAEASSSISASELIITFTENTTKVQYVRLITGFERYDESIILDSSLPPGTYTAEVHSVIKSFKPFEEFGISAGDRLIVEITRQGFAKATLPVEVYKVRNNSAAIRVELDTGLSFSDTAIFFLLSNLGYVGAVLNNNSEIEFPIIEEVTLDGELVEIASEASTFYELLKYPPEALGFDIFLDTKIILGDLFIGTIEPKYLVRNTKIPKPNNLSSVGELRNFISEKEEFIEDGFVKSVTSEGEVFIKSGKSIKLLQGADFEIDDTDFISLIGFSYSDPAPRKLWSPLSLFSADYKLEENFSKCAGLTYQEYLNLTSTLSYKEMLQGLMFAYSEGATLQSVELGLHLLLDIPIVTEESLVEVIGSPIGDELHYRVLNSKTLAPRDIFLPKREYIDSRFDEIGINRTTENFIEVGDIIPPYTPLSQFVKVEDNIGGSTKVDQLHKWKALVDISVLDSTLIPKTKNFLNNIKPAYTYVDFVFLLFLVDNVSLTDTSVELDLHYFLLDTIGPYQSERSVDSWAHSAILRRFDSASYTLRTYSYGRGLQVIQTNLVDPNANPEYYNPFLSTHTEIRHPLFGTSSIDTDSTDSVQVGDFLVLTTGINQGVYEIGTIHSNGTWSVSPATEETDSDATPDPDYVDFYVVRLDNNAATDSDDNWEELSPLDVPSFDMNFGSATVSGSLGTLTHSSLASGTTFEVLNVRPGDIIIVDSVEYDIISVSGSNITIQNQDTFTNKQFVIRRFL